jgi:hypothetical protein
LQQRADFLRPDSLVAVIAVTDENDCSVIDGGQNFYAIVPSSAGVSVLAHGTTPCLTNPNDPCCFNCAQAAPAGCGNPAQDAECAKGQWTKAEDPENLRCFHQKQRYGVDFLYPISRYVTGLMSDMVPDRSGAMVKNPLYSDLTPDCVNNKACTGERDKSFVFLAGIVGVPWQDIAKNPMDLTQGYLTAKDITDNNIWAKIVGDPANAAGPVLPTDLHMVESVQPRAGLSPIDSAWNADPINGHEWDISKVTPAANSDLQYACVFPKTAHDCGMDVNDCDCAAPTVGTIADIKNPLCQSMQNTYSTVQSRAKGYPGIRELQVLEGLGEQAIVASICPANTTNPAGSDYGYRPAIAALIDRLRNALRGRCLPRTLEVSADGTVPCVIVEVYNPPPGGSCVCEGDPMYGGRVTATESILTPEIKEQGSCRCEILQLTGGDQTTCSTSVVAPPGVTPGWCYVDPAQTGNVAQCPLVASCPSTDKRIIRFVNSISEPRAGATAFIMCQEKSFPTTGGGAPMNPCPTM